VGGDEFAIILAPPTSVDDVEAIIERITDGMRAAIDLPDGRAVAMSVSIGYAGFPLDATTLDDLVRLADQDMYRNKARLYEERIVHLG
jgi:diguanylate cyclase (GGDEF)-like protein